MIQVLPISQGSYHSSSLHGPDRIWQETNCSVDVWIELLNALGMEPVPACACALSSGVLGDQWTFLKFPAEDIWQLYRVAVAEMYIWRPLIDHIEEQLSGGRLVTVEADSWYLPDTAGTAYRMRHMKSAIVPNAVDRAGRYLEYFHGRGYWKLSGDDFDGVMGIAPGSGLRRLPPYVETVQIDDLREASDLPGCTMQLVRSHVARRPDGNPVVALAERLTADLPWLAMQPIEAFHDYAFGMIRQCGAAAELASTVIGWLVERGSPDLGQAIGAFASVAADAKKLLFQVARASQGRTVAIGPTLDAMATAWATAMATVTRLAEWPDTAGERRPAETKSERWQ
jgi:hypothetical protein